MRKSVVSGPSTKMRPSHSAAAAATSSTVRAAPGIHDPDPAKEILERSRSGRTGYAVSPTGRAASPKPSPIASAHAPSVRIDSPARSPQSAKLEADRAGRHGTAHTPTQGGAPERVLSGSAGGQNLSRLAFVKDAIGHKETGVLEARPRTPINPEGLSVHKEPEGVGSVEASRWQILGLSIDGQECLREELREGGVEATAIGPDTFHFVPCPAGAPVVLRVRNDSGRPACLSAVLTCHVEPAESAT